MQSPRYLTGSTILPDVFLGGQSVHNYRPHWDLSHWNEEAFGQWFVTSFEGSSGHELTFSISRFNEDSLKRMAGLMLISIMPPSGLDTA